MAAPAPPGAARMAPDAVKALTGQFVRAVGAAFFPDTTQIVLDMLVRFHYLRADQVNKQLGISGPAVTGALEELVQEGLVSRDEFNVDEKGHAKVFYFINYRHFLDVVSFRVYQMQLTLKEQHRDVRHDQKWHCKNCGAVYDALAALAYAYEGGRFYCPRCSLAAGRLRPDPFFLQQRSAEADEQGVLDLQRKVEVQLAGEPGLRPSLYDLIGQVRSVEAQLATNIPDETPRYREEFKNSRRSPVPEAQKALGGANGRSTPVPGTKGSGSAPAGGGSLFDTSAAFVSEGAGEESALDVPWDYSVEVTLDGTGNAVESKVTQAEVQERDNSLPDFLRRKAAGNGRGGAGQEENGDEGEDDEDVEWED